MYLIISRPATDVHLCSFICLQVEDINLVREEDTGKSKGFAFLKYEDSRSCILAVDNLTGSKVRFACRRFDSSSACFPNLLCSCLSDKSHILVQSSSFCCWCIQILGRSIRVDHVENYRLPKHLAERENGENSGSGGGAGNKTDKTAPGHAYQGQELASSFDISKGQDLFAGPPVEHNKANGARLRENHTVTEDVSSEERRQAKRARKKARDEKRREKEERRMRKEEKRRIRRARKMKGDTGSASNDDEYGGSRGAHQKEREREKRKKYNRHQRTASRSRSYDRYSSDGGSLSSNGSARKL